MLELNEEKNKLEGELALTDSEKNNLVSWLKNCTGSFFIGDDVDRQTKIKNFIGCEAECYIDINSYLSYLAEARLIFEKFRYMYHESSIDWFEGSKQRFSDMSPNNAKIILSYNDDSRYLCILNDKKDRAVNILKYGEEVLKNGNFFRHTLLGKIAHIEIINMNEGRFKIFVKLVDNWRETIMEENNSKVTLESIIGIFNKMVQAEHDNLDNEQKAIVFGIRYAPLLKCNESKFTYEDVVNGSNFNSEEIKEAVKLGISISHTVLWEKKNEIKINATNDDYIKFKKLLSWFINQLNINNDLVEGEKTSGKGYEGRSLLNKYKDWREYTNFNLDCTIQCGYQSVFDKSNYIHKEKTSLDIRPNFDKESKQILHLYVDVGEDNKSIENVELQTILNKKFAINDLDLFSNEEPNIKLIELFDDYSKAIDICETSNREREIEHEINGVNLQTGRNIILYGVPGAGKSYKIDEMYPDGKVIKIRVVFHPDYTYSDFVGQIMPREVDGTLRYPFIPGPFTKALEEAEKNKDKQVVLIIEEINRGNAAAIFGDIFQLLDRKEESRESCYKITNFDIAKYLFDDETKEIGIPSNMSIVCTMNTSDQNVFTLDTAFQRRREMRLVENKFGDDSKELAEAKILDTSVSWGKFNNTINELILEKNQNMMSTEDKRLGTHFISLEDIMMIPTLDEIDNSFIEQKIRKFPEKVIKYLWDDAFKLARDEVFNEDYNSLEKLIAKFSEAIEDERFDIFNDDVKNKLKG